MIYDLINRNKQGNIPDKYIHEKMKRTLMTNSKIQQKTDLFRSKNLSRQEGSNSVTPATQFEKQRRPISKLKE